MTIGAVSGGMLMKIGRRKAVIISCSIGLLGSSISILPLNLYSILIGRFIFGISSGLLSSITPRFLEETIPNHLFDTLQPIWTFSGTIGTITAYYLINVVP